MQCYEKRNQKYKDSNSSSIYKINLSYCLKCRKNTEIENSKLAKMKKGRKILSSKPEVCDSKKNEIYSRARRKRFVKVVNCFVINIFIDKSCCNFNLFIKYF